MDLVFGDHAEIYLNESVSHQLDFAKTTNHSCGGGNE